MNPFEILDVSLTGKSQREDCWQQVVANDARLDRLFEINDIAVQSTQREDFYPTLNDSALNTSYLDFIQILNDLNGNQLVDIGCGMARCAFLCASAFKHIQYTGIEVVTERVERSQNKIKKFGMKNIIIQQGDVSSSEFQLPIADNYFLYFPVNIALEYVMKHLYEISQKNRINIYVIESHGDLLNWLNLYQEWLGEGTIIGQVSLPRHNDKIYRFTTKQITKLVDQDMFRINPLRDRQNYYLKHQSGWVLPLDRVMLDYKNQRKIWSILNPERIFSWDEALICLIDDVNLEQAIHLFKYKIRGKHGHLTKVFYRDKQVELEFLDGTLLIASKASSYLALQGSLDYLPVIDV